MTHRLPDSTEPWPPRVRRDVRGVLAQLGPQTDLGRARRQLLPGWIKFFSWLFLLMSAAVPAVVLTGLVSGSPISFALFGFRYTGSLLNINALLLILLIMGCGTTAYGLLWGKSWGQFAAVTTGWYGLVMCTASVFVTPGFNIPLEPILLIPFLIKMSRLKVQWREAAGD